jgi:thiol:disulfide interchange protein DsbC
MPQNDGKCANPVDRNIALGNKLRVTGTPTLIFANGQRVPGMVPANKLKQMLDQAAR